MKKTLGTEYPEFERVYDEPPYKAVRVNTLKISATDLKKSFPFELMDAVTPPKGKLSAFYYDFDKIGRCVEYSEGLLYPQEPSAMFVSGYLDAVPGDRVLDLCAAPGGKSTQIAEALRGEGVLFANEISPSRAKILASNIERFGVRNSIVLSSSPEKLAEKLPGYFDKILVDAPCSGEGMFRKEPEAANSWSEKVVSSCAERQKDILARAYRMLAGGGTLVYSTCTFSEEEDEGVVEDFLKVHADCALIESEKFLPHRVRGEGHFVAKIIKDGEKESLVSPLRKKNPASGTDIALFKKFADEAGMSPDFNIEKSGSSLYAAPKDWDVDLSGIYTLSAGVKLGDVEKGVFKPSHALAMCLKGPDAKYVEVGREAAIKYLSGETFDCDVFGWFLVTYGGFPLGWCKGVSGKAKNHLPKGLRLPNAV